MRTPRRLASSVGYDPTASGLVADDVQEALDEVAGGRSFSGASVTLTDNTDFTWTSASGVSLVPPFDRQLLDVGSYWDPGEPGTFTAPQDGLYRVWFCFDLGAFTFDGAITTAYANISTTGDPGPGAPSLLSFSEVDASFSETLSFLTVLLEGETAQVQVTVQFDGATAGSGTWQNGGTLFSIERVGDAASGVPTPDAASVSYDNDVSGLTAVDVQAALDELADSGGGGVAFGVNNTGGFFEITASDFVEIDSASGGIVINDNGAGGLYLSSNGGGGYIESAVDDGGTVSLRYGNLRLAPPANGSVLIATSSGAKVGFFSESGVAQQSITGVTALQQIDSIIAALVAFGLVTDDR